MQIRQVQKDCIALRRAEGRLNMDFRDTMPTSHLTTD